MSEVNTIQYSYDNLDEAFPPIDCGMEPMGYRCIFQLRLPKRTTKGGIILPQEVRDIDSAHTQVAKVVAVGPVAFRDRTTLKPWPEGAWCQVGDLVRVPKYGTEEWTIKPPSGVTDPLTGQDYQDEIRFILLRDLDIMGKIVGDHSRMKAFT